MNLQETISRLVFAPTDQAAFWLELTWAAIKKEKMEQTETLLSQLEEVLRAVALKKLIAEFYNQMTGCGNDIGSLDVFSVLDELEIGEEAIWFLAGIRSVKDENYTRMLLAREDIHEMLEYMIYKEAIQHAEKITKQMDLDTLFIQLLTTVLLEESGEEVSRQEGYLQAVETNKIELDRYASQYSQAYEWVQKGMPLIVPNL